MHRRAHQSSRGGRLSHRPPLCPRPAPPRNPDPSLFCTSCAAALRCVPGNAVAAARGSARHVGFFGIAHGPPAAKPSGCARRSPPRNTLALGHTGDTRTPACRSGDTQTPELPPAPPTCPPAGRWTAPGQAGIKTLPSGSPTGTVTPGARGWIAKSRPGPSLILTEAAPRRLRAMRRPLAVFPMPYLQDKSSLTRTRQKLPRRYTIALTVFVAI